jgi:hypothetical protein
MGGVCPRSETSKQACIWPLAEAEKAHETIRPLRVERRRGGDQPVGKLDAPTERRQGRPATAERQRNARSDAPGELGIDEDELGADAWKVVDASADAAGRRRHASSVGMSAPARNPPSKGMGRATTLGGLADVGTQLRR